MPLKSFQNDGLTLAYLDEGTGPPILLIHGFASNHAVNWAGTSWVKTLVTAGRRVIAIDNRGHGRSQVSYDPDRYSADQMAADAIALLDHLALPKAVVMGYSMGARISAVAALAAPEKVDALVLSGMAANMLRGVGGTEAIAAALLAPSLARVSDLTGRAFRLFAEQTGSDLKALAACIRGSRRALTAQDVAKIAVPTLVVVGSDDDISGPATPLATVIPGAEAVTLPGKDHMSAVGDQGHKAAVLSFLEKVTTAP